MKINNNEIISVVVPVYNVELYLDRCIYSIVNQSYRNLQIILVDDGSTDKSSDICNKWATKDSRITVIHKENGGLSDARNVGIDFATGKYITFVDSDDLIDVKMIQYLYDLIYQCNGEMSICHNSDIDENDRFIRKEKKYFDIILDNIKDCFRYYYFAGNNTSVAWGKLYKIELFDDIRYPVKKLNEDNFTTYKLIAKCSRIIVGKNSYYFYRQRSNSIMNCRFKMNNLDVIEAAIEERDFLRTSFPEIYRLFKPTLIGAANTCVKKIIKSELNEEIEYKVLPYLQKIYKSEALRFISVKNGNIKAKLFSCAAFINLRLTVLLIKKILMIWELVRTYF